LSRRERVARLLFRWCHVDDPVEFQDETLLLVRMRVALDRWL